MLSIDADPGIESELVDIGTLPLTALRSWNSAAMRLVMRDVVRRAGSAQVCDQQRYNDWTS